MAILAYGLSFRTAAIDLRERIAFPADDLGRALANLRRDTAHVSEIAILSTCNRTELYCAADDRGHNEVVNWLAQDRRIEAADLTGVTYAHWERDAARHVMRVASGLDSQVLGEPQIMGQVKTAYELARDAGTLGPELALMSQVALNVAKRVRTETDIGRSPVSVAYAAVTMAQQIFSHLDRVAALLVGAGETIELVARHLRDAGVTNLAITNRTATRAEALAAEVGARAITLAEVPAELERFDVVISSTGSAEPVIFRADVERAIKARRRRPMFMVDIAVPRDIEASVGELSDVYLYSIDDLTEIIEDNLANRRDAAERAERLIDAGAEQYTREQRIRSSGPILKQLRQRADAVREAELQRARKRLAAGADPAEVIERLSRDLANKLTHAPTVALRNASADGNNDQLDYLRKLYDLD